MTTIERTTHVSVAKRQGFDWPLATALLGTVAAMYAAIGYVAFALFF